MSRRWSPKSWFTWSISPLNLLLHDSWIVPKGQTWQDKIQKKHWQLWKVGGLKQLVSFFGAILTCWERKQPTSLSNLRPVDQKALSSRSKVSIAKFWSLYKPWRWWRSSWNSMHLNILSSFHLSQPSKLLESYLL